jgi:hypothetical protein
MTSHTVYLYDYCDQYTRNSMSVCIFTSKKEMYDHHIMEYFNDLDDTFSQESKRCWHYDTEYRCKEEKNDFEETPDSDDFEETPDLDDFKKCNKCNKQLITLSEYKQNIYPTLMKQYDENGINEKNIYTDTRVLFFED